MATGCFKGSSLSAQHAILLPFFKGGGKRQCSSLLGNIGTGVSLLCSTEYLRGASDASTQSFSCKNMAALSTGASFKKKISALPSPLMTRIRFPWQVELRPWENLLCPSSAQPHHCLQDICDPFPPHPTFAPE